MGMARLIVLGWPNSERETLCLGYSEGGAYMIEIESYIFVLKVKWIKMLIDIHYQSAWKELQTSQLNELTLSCLIQSTANLETKLPKWIMPLRFLKAGVYVWRLLASKEIQLLNYISLTNHVLLTSLHRAY